MGGRGGAVWGGGGAVGGGGGGTGGVHKAQLLKITVNRSEKKQGFRRLS